MFQDILKESWVYQEIGQEFLEQGLEKGREEERQRRVQEQHQMLLHLVQTHFPEITSLVKQKADAINDPEVLKTMILNLLDARTVEEARSILLKVDKQ